MVALLLVEDDEAISGPLAGALRREGYDVEVVDDGHVALARGRSGEHDLVLLDLGLPGVDGLEICREIRRALPDLPVLVLTARAEEVDAVVGLDAGADDYVPKPFRLAELLARIRALLRRGGAPALRAAGGVEVDVAARRAWRDGTALELTPKEFDLLALLLANAGVVVTRERIMADVWDWAWIGSTKTLDMHVSALRRKLRDDPASPKLLSTVRGVGFRFERA